jgi:hypothetical protein
MSRLEEEKVTEENIRKQHEKFALEQSKRRDSKMKKALFDRDMRAIVISQRA